MTAIILDTETTGLAQPRPCQVGYIAMRPLETYGETLPLGADNYLMYQANFNPGKGIENGATMIHGLTDADVAECPPWTEFSVPEHTQYIIGHNIQFDARALGHTKVHGYRYICTIKLAKVLWPGEPTYKLQELIAKHYPSVYAQISAGAHTALVDCKHCLLLLRSALDELEGLSTWEDIYTLAGYHLKA